mgnify:CR=1 FL=1
MITPGYFRRRSLALCSRVLPAALLIAASAQAATTPVSVPVYLDYPMLRQLLVSQLFNTADGSREILNDPGGCSQILLSNPRLGAQ